MNKVYLDELPKWQGGKGNGQGRKGSIKWKDCISHDVKFIYNGIEGVVKIVDYETKRARITIEYLEKIFNIKTGHFSNCHLGKIVGEITSDFKIEISTVFKDDKRDLVITDREYRPRKTKEWTTNWKYYKYTCNKCKWTEGWIAESNLVKGIGCSCCGFNSKTVVEGINDIPTTDPWMIKFFQGGYDEAKLYTRACSKRIKPICADCGRIKDKSIMIKGIYDNKSIRCRCGDGFSYPEKVMLNILEQLEIDFETQKVFYEIEFTKKYDFYIPSLNCIIETHGGQHYLKNGFKFLNGKTLYEEQLNDKVKEHIAVEVFNIKFYIVIDCQKSEINYIKQNIIMSELSNLLDLDKIDWLKCEEFALSNLAKIACDYKKNNPNLTTTEIGKIMNIDHNPIRKYLKSGAKLGWCEYDAKEEMVKSMKRNTRNKK